MFKKEVQSLADVLQKVLRQGGLDTPLNQQRLIDAWDTIMGPTITRYTGEKFIKNQTLFVKITSPALRQDLSMMKTQLVKRLNEAVGGGLIISDVHIY